MDHGIGVVGPRRSKGHPLLAGHPPEKRGGGDELQLAVELCPPGSFLHLALRLTGQLGLPDKAFGVDAVDGVGHEGQIGRCHHGVGGQIVRERHLAAFGAGLFGVGHDAGLLFPLARKLGLDLKQTDGVYFVAKEVNAEGVFGGVGKHVEDGTAQGELTGLVDVVLTVKAQFEQTFGEVGEIMAFALGQTDAAVGKSLAGSHAAGQGSRTSHHEQRAIGGGLSTLAPG